MDRDKSYSLDRQELEEGMARQGLSLSVPEIDLLINFYDNDGAHDGVPLSPLCHLPPAVAQPADLFAGKGALNYDELVAALKDELTERRWALVRKAFDMLDHSNSGM